MKYLLRILFFHLRKKKTLDWESNRLNLFFRLRDLEKMPPLPNIVLLISNYLTGKKRINKKRCTALDYLFRKSLRKNAKELDRVISCGVCR